MALPQKWDTGWFGFSSGGSSGSSVGVGTGGEPSTVPAGARYEEDGTLRREEDGTIRIMEQT